MVDDVVNVVGTLILAGLLLYVLGVGFRDAYRRRAGRRKEARRGR